MQTLVKNQLSELKQICELHHVSRIFLFGSATNETFNDKSDVDFLVEFSNEINPIDYADNFFSLLENLKKLYNRKIDLVTTTSVKNPILQKEIENTKIILFEA